MAAGPIHGVGGMVRTLQVHGVGGMGRVYRSTAWGGGRAHWWLEHRGCGERAAAGQGSGKPDSDQTKVLNAEPNVDFITRPQGAPQGAGAGCFGIDFVIPGPSTGA